MIKELTLENVIAYFPVVMMALFGWITIPFAATGFIFGAVNPRSWVEVAFVLGIAACCPIGWIATVVTMLMHAYYNCHFKWIGWGITAAYSFFILIIIVFEQALS